MEAARHAQGKEAAWAKFQEYQERKAQETARDQERWDDGKDTAPEDLQC
jgi:hypothetical protein